MKKTAKTIMAFLTALTITSTGFTSVVSAEGNDTAVTADNAVTEGVFKDGASYKFIGDFGALIIEGNGSFTVEEYTSLTAGLSPRVVVFGKDVQLPVNKQTPNEFLTQILGFDCPYTVFTYKDSEFKKKYDEVINYYLADMTDNGIKTYANYIRAYFRLFYVDKLKYYDSDEPTETYFQFPSQMIERMGEMKDYLLNYGADEVRAEKISALYLLGLEYRMELGRAKEDGSEKNDTQLKLWQGMAEDIYETEKDIADFAAGSTVQEVLNRSGLPTIVDLLYTESQRMIDGSFEVPDEEYYAEQEKQAQERMEGCKKTAAEKGLIMKEYLLENGVDEGAADEIIGYYQEGLAIRIFNYWSFGDGDERNTVTENYYKDNCLEAGKLRMSIASKTDKTGDKEALEDIIAKLKAGDFVYNYDKSLNPPNRVYDAMYNPKSKADSNDGSLRNGNKYHFNPETKGIYIEGNGVFTHYDYQDLIKSFDMRYWIFGKDVDFQGADYTDDYTAVDIHKNYNRDVKSITSTFKYDTYTFHGTVMEQKYNEMIDYLKGQGYREDSKSYNLNFLDDDADPYQMLENPGKTFVKKLNGFANENGIICFYTYNDLTNKLTIRSTYSNINDLGTAIDEFSKENPVEWICIQAEYDIPSNDTPEESWLLKCTANDSPYKVYAPTGSSVYMDFIMKVNKIAENEIATGSKESKKDIMSKYSLYITTEEENAEAEFAGEFVKKAVIPEIDTSAILTGDADLNGEVGLSDVTKLSKFIINEKLYPLSNATAQVNADMNGDTNIDSLDNLKLIEVNLGN